MPGTVLRASHLCGFVLTFLENLSHLEEHKSKDKELSLGIVGGQQAVCVHVCAHVYAG